MGEERISAAFTLIDEDTLWVAGEVLNWQEPNTTKVVSMKCTNIN